MSIFNFRASVNRMTARALMCCSRLQADVQLLQLAHVRAGNAWLCRHVLPHQRRHGVGCHSDLLRAHHRATSQVFPANVGLH